MVNFRRRVERFGMFAIAGVAIAALTADFDWLDRVLPADWLPRITLLVLCGITLFLLLELDRFLVIDSIDRRLDGLVMERKTPTQGYNRCMLSSTTGSSSSTTYTPRSTVACRSSTGSTGSFRPSVHARPTGDHRG